jgi:hypothetical protein
MRLKELCRAFDEKSVQALGGYVTGENVEPHIKLEAIKMLFERGHGRPKGEKKHKHTGADGKEPITVEIVYRPREEKK